MCSDKRGGRGLVQLGYELECPQHEQSSFVDYHIYNAMLVEYRCKDGIN